jgi:hypothetical protein
VRICLDDYSKPVNLQTEDGEVGFPASLGKIQEPNGDLEYISLYLPGGLTYVAQDTITGNHTVVVLPEGLTPEHFGWKGWQFIRLSTLIEQLMEDTT